MNSQAAERWSWTRANAVGLATFLALTLPASAQWLPPPLPDLKFAEIGIGTRTNYLGDRWSYMEAGPVDAPTVVMLHGVGGNSTDWRFQLAGLSDQFRVVAWNAPGYMLSDGLRVDRPGCRDYANAFADFLDAVHLTRVNVVGNSFGTRVAQCFAIHFPTRIIKLVLTGVGVGPKSLSEEEKARTRATRAAQIADGGYGFGARADALIGPNTSPELLDLIRNGARATNPRGFMHGVELGLSDGYSPDEVAAKVTVPVLLISGSADRVNPIETNAALLQKAMPRTRLEVVDGIGHLPHLEAPDRVNRLLKQFLAK
jgi:pimeloyl-ACP methyl ester carboxylesterase